MWRSIVRALGGVVMIILPLRAQVSTFNPIVYREAIPAMLGGTMPDTILVAPKSIRLALPQAVVMRGGDYTERLARFDAIPPGLPERLDSLSVASGPVERLGLPPGVRVLDDSSAALLWAGDWKALRQRLRVPRGVIHLTPVAYATGGSAALVGMLWDCGPGCRRAMVAWLVPDGGGGWKVTGTHRFPMQ